MSWQGGTSWTKETDSQTQTEKRRIWDGKMEHGQDDGEITLIGLNSYADLTVTELLGRERSGYWTTFTLAARHNSSKVDLKK